MDKTNVDALMLEMIAPKIEEIKEKFSRGEALSQEDVNMLLLKSQYNHINHLDDKLNEVTASVVFLEGKFIGLEGKFENLKTDLEGKFENLKLDIDVRLEKLTNKLFFGMTAIMGAMLTLFQVFGN